MNQQKSIFQNDHMIRIKDETYDKLCSLRIEVMKKTMKWNISINDTINYLLEIHQNGNK